MLEQSVSFEHRVKLRSRFKRLANTNKQYHSNPQANAVAQSMGAQYIECSAKQNNGVNEVFQVAVEHAVGNQYGKKKRTRNCSIL
jgi:hypothetical protein